jgi:methyl-accepting chemotaxis protein
VSQEVTASAQQASELTTQNLEKAEETNQYVLELIETSGEMGKYIN